MRRRQRRDAVRGSGPSLPAASYSSSWCPHHRVWRFLRPPPSFSRQLAARGAKTAILSTYPGEAATFQSGSCCPEPITVRGWPRDPSTLVGYSVAFDTVERAFAADRGEGDLCAYDLVLLALPAFAHDAYLNALAPWIEKSANAHAHMRQCVCARPCTHTCVRAHARAHVCCLPTNHCCFIPQCPHAWFAFSML